MQELGREMGAVRPNKGVEFLIHLKVLEVFPISQGLKDRTVEPVGQIDLTHRAVVEVQPNDIVPHVPGLTLLHHEGVPQVGLFMTIPKNLLFSGMEMCGYGDMTG